jgi:hypothetical protein
VDPRAGLDDVEKRKFFTLPGLELRPLGRPARSNTDYAIPALLTTRVLKETCKCACMSYFTLLPVFKATVFMPSN